MMTKTIVGSDRCVLRKYFSNSRLYFRRNLSLLLQSSGLALSSVREVIWLTILVIEASS